MSRHSNRPFATLLTFVTCLSSPISTANWSADSDDVWTLPVGGGGAAGKILKPGRLPVNVQLQAFANVIRPDNGPDWQPRLQVQFLFPR